MKDEKPDAVELSEIEKSAIGEICDLIISSLAQTFGDSLGEGIGMNPSTVEPLSMKEAIARITTPVLLVQLNSNLAIKGSFLMIINGDSLPKIFDIAIPEDAKEVGADDEVILDELKKLINSAVSGAFENLAQSIGRDIDCSVIDVTVLQDESGFGSIDYLYPDGNLLYVEAILNLPEGGLNTGLMLPTSLSSQMIELLLSDQSDITEEAPRIDTVFDNAEESPVDVKTIQENSAGDNLVGVAGIPEVGQAPKVREIEHDLQPAKFNTIDLQGGEPSTSNISLLLDVMLDASIELGKTHMTIEDILGLAKGSVIELDKLASEPVEFLVNGKVIARGEVVVIDDNFGIRITEILSPRARLESL